VEHFLLSIGYPAIFFLALVEAICIPFPSEVTFGYTGYLASQGKLSLVAIIVVGVLGEFIGSMIAYAIGRSGGRAIIDRYGKYVLLSHRDLDKTDAFMAKYGDHAPAAYPDVHHLTSPIRAAARRAGDADAINLWAGQAYRLAREEPAGDVVRRLGAEARTAVRDTARRLQ